MKLSLVVLQVSNITLLLGSLLLATTTTFTLTLAQDAAIATTITCDPTAVAAVDENAVCDADVSYCSATSKTCIAIGSCANDVVDCNNINNGPYPVLLCMGTMECTNEGMCLMNCGEVDDPTFDETDDNNNTTTTTTTTTISTCMKSSECNNIDFETNSDLSESFMVMDDGEYCGSDSTCMSMGDCLIIDDCMNMDNLFPIPACMVSLILV
jgi:hypothetical protein